jgi:PPP family 3-phenylpropionic acid transporter
MDYGRVRVWGSIAFVIGSAQPENWSASLIIAVLAMLTLGLPLCCWGCCYARRFCRREIAPSGCAGWKAWRDLVVKSWRFLAAFRCRGARCLLWFQRDLLAGSGYSASTVGYLWSLGVVAEVVIFALSKKLFRRFSARDAAAFRRLRTGALD